MGQMYCFGRLKTTGDNTMYPVPFMDLQGWNLRSVACGATTYAACGEDQAITWGQGGGNGELGYGPDGPKSSANPKLVDFARRRSTSSRWRAASATRCS